MCAAEEPLLQEALASHSHFELNPRAPNDFTIIHYAGAVCYNAGGFLDKNKDTLNTGARLRLRPVCVRAEVSARAAREGGLLVATPRTARTAPAPATLATHLLASALTWCLCPRTQADLVSLHTSTICSPDRLTVLLAPLCLAIVHAHAQTWWSSCCRPTAP